MDTSEPDETTTAIRELASRESNGVRVLLLWDSREDAVMVSVDDPRIGQRFELVVDRRSALDAFYHPYAYAA